MEDGKYIILLVMAIALVWCTITLGNVTNGGFESGDLNGWSFSGAGPDFTVDPFGDPGAVTFEMSRDFLPPIAPDWTATEGNYFASLWSTDSLGTDVSTLSQTFSAPAGYSLVFDYFFDFGDIAPFYDTAMGTLTWPTGSATLFEHNTPGHELGDDENVGWTTISYSLPETAMYTLEFRIEDFDGTFESILGVDNVQVIPAPSALLLAAIGLSSLRWLRKRKTLLKHSEERQ